MANLGSAIPVSNISPTVNTQPTAATPPALPKTSTGKKKKVSGRRSRILVTVVVGGLVLLCCCLSVAGGGLLITSAFEEQGREVISSLDDADDDSDRTLRNAEIGKTGEVDDWEVTLDNARRDGTSYVFDLTIRNRNSNQRTFDTVTNLNLINGDGENYGINFFYDIEEEQRLDGKVDGNDTIIGRIAYFVDDNPESLQLIVDDGLFEQESIEFRIE